MKTTFNAILTVIILLFVTACASQKAKENKCKVVCETSCTK
jgi:hypothetical protein